MVESNGRAFKVGDFVEVNKDGVDLVGEVTSIKETELGVQTLTITHQYGVCKSQGGLVKLVGGVDEVY